MAAGAEEIRLAFDRAVRRERDAIVLHERAAAMHEAAAARLKEAALSAVDLGHADALREHAAAEQDYAFFAITDHSQALGITGGMTENELRAAHEQIRALQPSFPNLKLLCGVEVDVHVVHGNFNRLQNPIRVVKGLQLEVEAIVFNGLAASLTLLTNEQKELGALVIDIGGTHVKILATGQKTPRKIPSGPTLTPERMVAQIREAAEDWEYEAVSIGFPGPVLGGRLVSEPWNLGRGWVGLPTTPPR